MAASPEAAASEPLLGTRHVSTGELEAQAEAQSQAQVRRHDQKPTPLPVVKLAVICLMRITEPVSYTVLFPFINNDLHRNLPHVPKAELGYYAGIVESVFAFVQFLFILQWGRLSDKIGRKPVLITGLLGTSISISAFGLAKSLSGMILARSIAGALNGNIGVLKSLLAEITDESNQARAFSLIPLCYAVGSIIGPIIGAWLSEPADTFPALFDTPFWRDNPYFLPCAAAGSLNLLAAVFGFFFLSETLPSKVARSSVTGKHISASSGAANDSGTLAESGAGTKTPPLAHRLSEGDLQEARQLRRESSRKSIQTYGAAGSTDRSGQQAVPIDDIVPPKPSIWSLLTKDRFRILSSQMLLNYLNISYIALLPLMCYEPPHDGGAGFSKADIGNLLALNGVITIMVQLFLFPPMERKLGGPRNVIQRVLLLLPFVYILFPIVNLAARQGGAKWAWLVFMVILPCKTVSNTGAASATLLVINSSPHPSALGTLNGLSQTLASLSRAAGPLVSTSLFAFSASHPKVLGGYLVWLVMAALSFACWALTLRIPAAYNRRAVKATRRPA